MAYTIWYARGREGIGLKTSRKGEHKQTNPSRNDAGDLLSVQETLRGNRHAFDSIVERYTPLLFSLAYRMMGNREDAEEAVQEIFFKTYRALDSFKLSNRFHPWLYTIALNHLRSCLRRRKRKSMIKIIPFVEGSPGEMPSLTQQRPEEEVEQRAGEHLASKAILGLRREYREVFLLRQVEGLSVREASEILSIPEGTVKTYLHRARKDLIAFLAEKDWR
jgi:RNA polymerase sigma-70 factor (ECF subfamily)